MSQKNNPSQTDLHTFLAMCTLFDEVREKCVLASKAMIKACEQDQEKGNVEVDLSRLAEKRGQMIRFLEGLQIRVLDGANQEWTDEREAKIVTQRLDHFNRGVIRWSLEMENLESLLQANLEKLRGDTKDELATAFKRSKQHKGYNLNDIR